jgi:hypothetical protein
MCNLAPLAATADSHIQSLRGADVRIVLISVAVQSQFADALAAALLRIATRSELVGRLADGSIGLLCFRPTMPDLASELTEKFMPRLRLHLLHRTEGSCVGPVRIRAIARSTIEICAPQDLFEALSYAPDIVQNVLIRRPESILFDALFPISQAKQPMLPGRIAARRTSEALLKQSA